MRFVGSMLDIRNVSKYLTVNENGEEEEGHMCKALEDLIEDGRIEGRIEGLEEGRQSRQAEVDNLTAELAAAKAENEKLKALIKKNS